MKSVIVDYEYYSKELNKSKEDKNNALIFFYEDEKPTLKGIRESENFLPFSFNMKDKISFIHDSILNEETLDLFLDNALSSFPSNSKIEVQLESDYDLYASRGFVQPQFKNGNLYLYRPNVFISPKEIDFDSTLNKIYYALSTKADSSCPINFKFDIYTAQHLSKLASHSSILDKGGKIKQKEIAGCFKISKYERTTERTTERKENKIVAVLEIAKEDMILGDDQDVDIITTCKYTFHTHPREAYEKNNVEVAWPSSNDYKAYLYSVIYGKEGFHCVITIEGIYILSIKVEELKKIQGYNNSQKNEYYNKNSKIIEKHYDIPYPRKYSKNTNRIKEYCEFIQNNKNNNVFNILFLSWNQVYSGKTFFISLSKAINNCNLDN